MEKIIFRNGIEYLRVSKNNWKKYLNIISPNRTYDKNIEDCALKNKKYGIYCDVCNRNIGNFTKSCVNQITSINLQKYSNILFNDNLKKEEYYDIEIDRNENNSTI